jgi:Cd2+/Zn2+-exporting ATPase
MLQHAILDEIKQEQEELKIDVLLTALAGIGLLLGIIFQILDASSGVVVLMFLVTYLTGGIPAAKEAFADLRNGSLNIDLLMVLAALAAAGVGEVRDGAILLFLFSLAGTLEGYAMGSTKRAVASLMSLHPDTAWKKGEKGNIEKVAVEALVVSDVVIVKPGERIPIDGEVIVGEGAIDQSSITGESVPVDKSIGDTVFAGTLNQNAVLEIKVTAPAAQSTLARMITMVTEAQSKRAPSERFSDWFGERYTIVVLLGSVAGLIGFLLFGFDMSDALYRAATLLVVASPCAIVISVPAAILSALTAAARRGSLFKGGAILEMMSKVDIIAFDKTGTLTEGKLQVREVIPASGTIEEVLQYAKGLESNSEHPIARSICHYADNSNVPIIDISGVKAMVGKGIIGQIEQNATAVTIWAGNEKLMREFLSVDTQNEVSLKLKELEAQGKTTIVVGLGSSIIGYITLADTIRASSYATIEALRKVGVKRIVMLSGDAEEVVRAVGHDLGLDANDVFGGLLPEDKVHKIQELKKTGTVAFVGDGINDAAALVTADVGVAMGAAGADVAIEAADVALMSNDLNQLVTAKLISHSSATIIKQNLLFAVGIMILMIAVTLFWYLPLPLGVIGHEGGTLLVVANGLRILWQFRGE